MANFLPPRQIRVTGTPRMNGTRFAINFMAGTEYLFHFRVDIPTPSVPQVFNIISNLIKFTFLRVSLSGTAPSKKSG